MTNGVKTTIEVLQMQADYWKGRAARAKRQHCRERYLGFVRRLEKQIANGGMPVFPIV